MIPLNKFILDVILAIFLGGIIGYERQERQSKKGIYSAGLRTHILVCLSAMIMSVISVYSFPSDPARIIASIVTAAGFIAAGTVIASRGGEVIGLTTGVGLFTVAGLGMLIGLNYYLEAIALTVFLWAILELWRFEVKLGLKHK